MIIINFKNYKTGQDALKLARLIQKYDKKAIVAMPAQDIENISENTKLKVFAQHIDAIESEKATGFLSAKTIKQDGAQGTILNHSEHQIPFNILKKTLKICKKHGLKTLVCTKSVKEVKKIVKLKPWAIAFEDPYLIGTGKSITKYQTKNILKFIKLFKRTKIIPVCGAGISTANDVKAAYKLGCKGVLIASAIAGKSYKKAEKLLKEIHNH